MYIMLVVSVLCSLACTYCSVSLLIAECLSCVAGDAAYANPAPPAPLQQPAAGGSILGSIGGAVADGKLNVANSYLK
jgi:hypothetical protein